MTKNESLCPTLICRMDVDWISVLTEWYHCPYTGSLNKAEAVCGHDSERRFTDSNYCISRWMRVKGQQNESLSQTLIRCNATWENPCEKRIYCSGMWANLGHDWKESLTQTLIQCTIQDRILVSNLLDERKANLSHARKRFTESKHDPLNIRELNLGRH